MTRLVVASENQGKIDELVSLLNIDGLQTVSMRDAGFTQQIKETGLTYEENALQKARRVHQALGGFVLADDSGLSVDVLEGAPGIYSARFAGNGKSYPEKINYLWQMLKPWPPEAWTAEFVSVLALIDPSGREVVKRGSCAGRIISTCRGTNGFGYDPIFYMPSFGLTTAEMSPEQKNQVSHRGQAAAMLRPELLRLLEKATHGR